MFLSLQLYAKKMQNISRGVQERDVRKELAGI